MKNNHYLVTGGAGFIGSHIVETLIQQGAFVRVLDNFSTGRRVNLSFLDDSKYELLEGSLTDPEACQQACEGIDYVFHHGALASVPRSVEEPLLTNQVNVAGTLNLLLAARDKKVKRVVYAASSSAYGDAEISPKHEELLPLPKSPYAADKLSAEFYCRAFSEVYDLETACLRYFNVFGPRQDPDSQYSAVIPLFINAILQGKSPTVFGDGKQSRDFTYVANNVTANLQAAHAPGVMKGEVYNVACGGEFSLLDLIESINSILGSNVEPSFAPPRIGDVLHSCADISKASERFGYDPQIGFREGLEKTVAFYTQELAIESPKL